MLRRKQVDIPGWHLTDPVKMTEALTALRGQGWRGAVVYDDQADTWRLELHSDSMQPGSDPLRASLGDWLIDDLGLRLVTDAEFAAHYTEGDPTNGN